MRVFPVLVVLLLVLILASGCTSESIHYDSGILEAFKTQTEVRVIVRLKDNSGITITGTKEEKIELLRQRDEWFKPIIEDVLATLPETEIRDVRRLSDGFGGYVTEEGFEILLKNSHVKKIIYSSTVGVGIAD